MHVASWRPAAAMGASSVVPGMIAGTALAIASAIAALMMPAVVSESAIAVLFGATIATFLKVPTVMRPGLAFASTRILRVGIVLLGARLHLGDVIGTGGEALPLIVVCMACALGAGTLVSKRVMHTSPTALLVTIGTAVCGNSAIIAGAPLTRASQAEVSYAVTTITLVGVLSVGLYPVFGHALALDPLSFGQWAGTAVNDTSQVLATGYAYGQESGDVATVVKLTRNLFIAPVIVGLALIMGTSDGRPVRRSLRSALPAFVVGFAVVVALNSADLLQVPFAGVRVDQAMIVASRALILVALASVGLQSDLRTIRQMGLRPLVFGVGLAVGLSLLSLTLIVGGFGGGK